MFSRNDEVMLDIAERLQSVYYIDAEGANNAENGAQQAPINANI
jgi:hypothetical protein